MTGTPSEPTPPEKHDDLATPPPADPPADAPAGEAPPGEMTTEEAAVAPRRPRKKRVTTRPTSNAARYLPKIIAAIVLLGIPVALFLSSREPKRAVVLPASTQWATGSVQNIDITLMATDRGNLSCASKEEVAGRHCEFKAASEKWPADDKQTLRPYRLAGNNDPVLAAGVWSEPAVTKGLPNDRFTLRCKYKVEGKVTKPGVRWQSSEPTFYDEPFDWPAGSVSDCAITR